MKLSLTDAEFETYKTSIVASFSEQFGVAESWIKISKRAKRRRNLWKSFSVLTMDVSIQTHDQAAITDIIMDRNFEDDIGGRISSKTGLVVEIFDVSALNSISFDGSSVTDKGDSNRGDGKTWVYILSIALLSIQGVLFFLYRQRKNTETLELHAENISISSSKRDPMILRDCNTEDCIE